MEIRRVAGKTIVGQPLELIRCMTRRTAGRGMRTDQWKIRVVELSVVPTGGRMAAFAILHPSQGGMIRLRCPSHIFLMAQGTFVRRPKKVPDLGSFVAAKTGDTGVDADQWEARAVVASNLFLGQPIRHRVAIAAVVAQLPAVNILVAPHTSLVSK